VSLLVALLAVLGQTGIFWQGDSEREAYYLVDAGVTSVMTDRILPQSILTLFAENGIALVSMSDVRYLTRAQWRADSTLVRERMEDPAHYYSAYPHHLAHIYVRDPSPLIPLPDHYLVMREMSGMSISDHKGIRLHHSFDLNRIQTLMRRGDHLEVFPYEWLSGDNAGIVKTWLREPDALFSLPAATSPSPNATPAVVLILLTFGAWMFGYTLMPTYRKSLSRYVSTHAFFTADAVHRRIRLEGPMVMLWMLSGAVSGIFLMVVTEIALTDHANRVLSDWAINPGPTGWFLIGWAASLSWDAFMLLWLYISGYRTAALYLWPRHLHFGIVVLAVSVLGGSVLAFMMSWFLWAFPIVWISCFYISILDHNPYMGGIRRRAVLFTAIPHVIFTAVFVSRFPETDLYESILLLLSLS
jgi:hypothetical protein